MQPQSRGMELFAAAVGMVVAVFGLNYVAEKLHLPWSLNVDGAKDVLLGESGLSTQPSPISVPPKSNPLPTSMAHFGSNVGWTSAISKLLMFLVLIWIITGITAWYRRTNNKTAKSLADFLAFRWAQISFGHLLKHPEAIHDAWERHAVALSGISGCKTSSQYAYPKSLRQVEQILYAAMRGSDIKVEEETGQGQAKRIIRRANLAATWEDSGWRIQLAWPRGFQQDIYSKWREWGPHIAPIALRHYGFPALKGNVDDYGFLHIPLERPGMEIPKDKNADTIHIPEREDKKNLQQETQSVTDYEGSLQEDCPPLSLLKRGKGPVGRPSEGKMAAKALEDALSAFQLSGTVHVRGVGPSLIQLAIVPPRGVSSKMIISRGDDLRMAANGALPGLTLEGTDTEIRALVTRTNREIVALRDLLAAGPPKNFDEGTVPLLFPLGVDIAGNPVWISLAKTPHLIIAGMTGSGKSVFSHSMVTSLTFRYTPDQLRFFLIDAKGTEMAFYEHIPHLLTPIISDAQKAIGAIKFAILEMDNRNQQFKEAGCRDFEGYLRMGYTLYRIVIFVDELYDLLVGAGKLRNELEDNLTRIAQKARSAGIHLVAATQKPTVEAIPSLLKGNVPSRMAFQVSSRTESGVILDETGAEKLIGNGDGLFKFPAWQQKERIQAAFIDDNTELAAVSKWWRTKAKSGPKGVRPAKDLLESSDNEASSLSFPPMGEDDYVPITLDSNDQDSLPPIYTDCLNGIADKLSSLSGHDVWRMNHVAQNVVQVCPVGAIIDEEQLMLAFLIPEEIARKAVQQMKAMGFITDIDGQNVLIQRWSSM